MRIKWEANPRYCDLCGGVIPYGRKRFCSKECQLEMKRRMAVQNKEMGEKRPKKAPQKKPGIESKAKELPAGGSFLLPLFSLYEKRKSGAKRETEKREWSS